MRFVNGAGIATLGTAALLLATASPAIAEDLVEDKAPESKQKGEGYHWFFTPGVSFAFGHSQDVVGQPDGYTLTLGANIATGQSYRKGSHEYRDTLAIKEAFSRTPVIDDFIKTADDIKFEALYLWHMLEWLGPYVRFSLQSQIFESFTVQPSTVSFNVTYLDGSTEDRLGRRYRLADGWMPLTLRESGGAFAIPYKSEPCAIEFRAGFGGLHTIAKDQFTVTGKDGDQVSITELDDFNAGAVELGVNLGGELWEKKAAYKAGAEFLIPVVNDDALERDPGELTNMEFYAGISFKLLKWMSLDYQFKAVKQPQIVDKFQIQNNLLLTIAYSWSDADEKKAE